MGGVGLRNVNQCVAEILDSGVLEKAFASTLIISTVLMRPVVVLLSLMAWLDQFVMSETMTGRRFRIVDSELDQYEGILQNRFQVVELCARNDHCSKPCFDERPVQDCLRALRSHRRYTRFEFFKATWRT